MNVKASRGILVAGVAVVASILAAVSGSAQQATFRSAVTLVTIDVTVIDREGRPVSGLTADDFVVKLDGKVQPVRAVAFVQAAAGPRDRAARETRGAAAPAGPPASISTEPRVFVLLADDLSFAPSRGKRLLQAAERFIQALPGVDLVGLATTSNTTTINPTTDRATVTQAMKKVVGEFVDPRVALGTPGSGLPGAVSAPLVSISDALEIDQGVPGTLVDVIARECLGGNTSAAGAQPVEVLIRDNDCAADVRSAARRIASQTRSTTSRQLERYLSVINALRGAPGIKHLVLMSDGVGMVREFADLIPVARAAATAGVQMSVLMEEPDINLGDAGRESPTPGIDPGTASHRRSDAAMFFATMQTVTDMSGGSFYRVIGDPNPFFDRVAIASSAVYRLGVEPLANTAPGREFAVAASVKRLGVTVLANRHAIAPDPAAPLPSPAPAPAARAPATTEEKLRAIVTSGEVLSAVPVRMGTAMRRGPSAGQIDMAVDIEIPSTVRGPIQAMFGVADASSGLKTGMRDLTTPSADGNYRLMFVVPLTEGAHRLRIAAADGGGALGSVEAAISAKLDPIGPFTSSDLLTSWVDTGGKSIFLALDELPADSKALQAALELYMPPGDPPKGEVHVLMSMTPGDPSLPALEREVTPQAENGVLRAAVEFPAADLAAGSYVLRAVVLIDDKVVGTKRALLRKK